MPRNGSGTYSRTDGTRTGAEVWQGADGAGVNIEADDHDTHDQDIAAALTQSVSKDGQTTMTGALPMGSQKITGLADGTAATDGATLNQVQGGAANFSTETGAADVYVVSPSPAIASLDTGTVLRWEPTNVNTGASTLNVSALGAVAIVTADGFALTGGELAAGRLVETVYDGTNHVLREVKDTLVMVDTDAGAAAGPVIDLKRVSASPAVDDDIGAIRCYGEDDGGNETLYVLIESEIKSPTGGAEKGALNFRLADGAGSTVLRLRLADNEVQVADSASAASAGPALVLRRSSASPADDDLGGYISNAMNNSAAARIEYGRIQGRANDVTAGTEDGGWEFQVIRGGSLITPLTVDNADVTITADQRAPCRINRTGNDGVLIQFEQDGANVGDISVSGTTVSYNGYLLTHWSQWGEGLEPEGLVPKGTLLSTVDELVVRADGETDPNHVKVKVTSERACRRVYGVFGGIDENGHLIVDAAGAALVRVRGPVEGGDLLMAGDEPGVSIVQRDSAWRACTIGKANMGYDGTGEALLPVALRAS